MDKQPLPELISQLLSAETIKPTDILKTSDGFLLIYQSLSDLLSSRGVMDFPDTSGERLACCRFFDDWFLYAVSSEGEDTYSLLKMREQEHDAADGFQADGDTPGVTISFVAFDCGILTTCLSEPTDENRRKLSTEIDRVVVDKGQRHHKALKRYFGNPRSCGTYLAADLYARHIASFAEHGRLAVPDHYKALVQQSISNKSSGNAARLPRFIDTLNQAAGRIVCDHETIYLENADALTVEEAAAILATHTGNTSVYSFAAEVEYHANFLTSLAKIPIPFFGRSIYDSAIRADMSVGDTEFQGYAPFYRETSRIVRRQYHQHHEK